MADKKKNSASKPSAKSKSSFNQKTLFDHFTKKTLPISDAQDSPNDVEKAQEPEINVAEAHESFLPLLQPATTTQDDFIIIVDAPPSQPIHAPPLKRPDISPAPATEILEILDDEIIIAPSRPNGHSTSSSSQSKSLAWASSTDGGTRIDPIILDSSPIKPARPARIPPLPPKANYSIFAQRRPASLAVSKTTTTSSVPSSEAPFPDQSSQHVQGPQNIFSSLGSSLLKPRKYVHRFGSTPIASGSGLLASDPLPVPVPEELREIPPRSSVDTVTYLQSIPTAHQHDHPAIARLVEASNTPNISSEASSSGQKLWTDKWRPTRAEHVIGNEDNAIYLREWLRALELQFKSIDPMPDPQQTKKTSANGKGKGKEEPRGTKRPRVVRAVSKKRGRKRQKTESEDENDWIVYSDDMFMEEDAPGDDDASFSPAGPSRLHRRESPSAPEPSPARYSFQGQMTNTVLLTGPSGSGKTSAVYACAEELGWEVFEVYPGIGKRSGANLDNLVGEVGKNHLVRGTQSRGTEPTARPKERNAFTAFLKGKKQADVDGQQTQAIADDPHSSSDFGFVTPLEDKPGANLAPPVRQSLVLLEEVDILFKDDSNFWPSVISFIRDCRRPVICTCNDPSLVPIHDLPIQATLTFQACPVPVAASYLQSLCCVEGHLIERDFLTQLYDSPSNITDDSDSTIISPDLRRTINSLQLRCPTIRPEPLYPSRDPADLSGDLPTEIPNTPESATVIPGSLLAPLRRAAYRTGLISFVDSYVVRTAQGLEDDNGMSSGDNELGHTIVFNPPPSLTAADNFGYADLDELIGSTAIRLSRGSLEEPLSRCDNSTVTLTGELFRARVRYRDMIRAIGHNEALPGPQILKRDAFALDYLPWIRHMVALDDQQDNEKNQKGTRITRNSQRYVRTISLTEQERKGVEESGYTGVN